MSDTIRSALLALDGKSSWGDTEDAREALIPLGRDIFPEALRMYPELRSFRARASLVYTAMKFALVEEDAFTLAIVALQDRSKHVIHYACMLLAISGRRDALDSLAELSSHRSLDVREDAAAAIAAIEEGNRNRFVDRQGTGKVKMSIGGLIEPTL